MTARKAIIAEYNGDPIRDAAQYMREAEQFRRCGRNADARYWQSMADALLDSMTTEQAIQAAYLAASEPATTGE